MPGEAPAAELKRRFAAGPEAVFAAFADPRLVARWLSPAPEIRLDVLAFDFRVGGAYRFAYHVPTGQIMTVGGAYRAIEPPRRIVFSWNIEPPDEHAGLQSEVAVTITPHAAGCELHILHTQLQPAGALERHRGGWNGALDRLGRLLDQVGG